MEEEGARNQGNDQQGQGQQQADGPPQARIRMQVNAQVNAAEGAAAQQRQQAQLQDPAQPEVEQPPNEAAVAAAEQLIEVDTSSLGRRIGGALLIPAIASSMGNLLLRLSKHSYWLRRFLAVRSPLRGSISQGIRSVLPPPLGPWSYKQNWEGLGMVKQLGLALRLGLGFGWNGTRTWAEADPVWWRNAVGFGLFVFVSELSVLLAPEVLLVY
jgi:hypothetical protein